MRNIVNGAGWVTLVIIGGIVLRGMAVKEPLRDCEGGAKTVECWINGPGVALGTLLDVWGVQTRSDRTFQKRIEAEEAETNDDSWFNWGNPRNERQPEEAERN